MNLREETIKVLRPFRDVAKKDIGDDEADTDTFIPMRRRYAAARLLTVGDLRAAAALLSRLEAGSGQETGWQPTHKHPKGGMYRLLFTAWTPDVPCELAIFEDASGRKYARQLSSFNEVYEALNQEGGDANALGRRPHVATPAPGENSERAEVARWMIKNGFATGHGDTITDLLSELSWQVTERVDKARRSMREEAAKWHDDKVVHLEEKIKENNLYGKQKPSEWESVHAANADCRAHQSHHRLAAAAIRAIPEKQS